MGCWLGRVARPLLDANSQVMDFCSQLSDVQPRERGCRRLLALLRPFETTVYVYDPYLPAEAADMLGFTQTSLEQVMQMDVVVRLSVWGRARTQMCRSLSGVAHVCSRKCRPPPDCLTLSCPVPSRLGIIMPACRSRWCRRPRRPTS